MTALTGPGRRHALGGRRGPHDLLSVAGGMDRLPAGGATAFFPPALEAKGEVVRHEARVRHRRRVDAPL